MTGVQTCALPIYEIWGYVFEKEAHKFPFEANDNSIGDAYRFVAIERYSKLVLNFALGRRDQATTDAFIEGLRGATAVQRSRSLWTDFSRTTLQSPRPLGTA